MQEDLKTAVFSANGLLWSGLLDATDLRQPVDAGYASCLKSLSAIEHRKLLDIENNAERWFGTEEPYTAKERRILITRWTGEAWKALKSEKYDRIRLSC